MLARKFRLRTKDVKFLTKKRNYFCSGFFGFFYIKQYDNLKFNQFSFHVPLKYSKRAVQRNEIRRALYNYYSLNWLSIKNIWWCYYKVFVVLQKNKLDEFKKQIENLEKKDTLSFVYDKFNKWLSEFENCLSK